jgi:hypothetical protein
MQRNGKEGGSCWVLRTALPKLRAPSAVISDESRVDASPLLGLQVAGKDVVSPVLERN